MFPVFWPNLKILLHIHKKKLFILFTDLPKFFVWLSCIKPKFFVWLSCIKPKFIVCDCPLSNPNFLCDCPVSNPNFLCDCPVSNSCSADYCHHHILLHAAYILCWLMHLYDCSTCSFSFIILYVWLFHCILVDSSTNICWMSPFVILGVSGLFCRFYFIFDGKSC